MLTMNEKTSASELEDWKKKYLDILPLLGHRNWVLIVDSAYPLQSNSSIETLDTGENIEEVAAYVLKEIDKSKHVRPIIYEDKELGYLTNDICPGVETLRANYEALLEGKNVQNFLHDDVFKKLDSASELFKVLVIKTTCTMPYTSLFVCLDCSYWPADAEKTLRDRMK